MPMTNSDQQQKKALLIAILISVAMHGVIISALSGAGKGEKITLRENTIKINLIEIKTKQKRIVPKPEPKERLAKNQKKPQAIRQLKPRDERQTASQKPEGDTAKTNQSPKPDPRIDNGSQQAKIPTVPTADTRNTRGSESVSKSTSPKSSKESTSIIQKETPRCRGECRKPRIPRRAEKRGEVGYAVFRLYISASGVVVKAELLESSGHTGWNNSARKTALSQSFYPMAQKNTRDFFYEMKTN